GGAMLVWLGQSGFFLKTVTGLKLVIDPFLSVWPDRLQPPLLAAADLPADCVLITHTHRDHLDVYALPIIAQAKPQAQFIGPPTANTIPACWPRERTGPPCCSCLSMDAAAT